LEDGIQNIFAKGKKGRNIKGTIIKYTRWLIRRPILTSEGYLEHVERKINGMKCGQT
jgi:hypothetical protein